MAIQTLRALPRIVGLAWLFVLSACGGQPQSRTVSVSAAPAEPGSTAQAPEAVAGETPSSPSWIEVDSAGRAVTVTLEVTSPPGSPSAMLNGFRAGGARLVVPLNWTVKWNWRSADSTARHSLVVMVQREKIPLEGGRPAFTNAMTRMVTEGLETGLTDQTTFVADEAGWYWLLCGVPDHALKGEWLELRVDPEAKTARAEEKKREQ